MLPCGILARLLSTLVRRPPLFFVISTECVWDCRVCYSKTLHQNRVLCIVCHPFTWYVDYSLSRHLVFTVLQLSAFARVKVAVTARLRLAFGGRTERRLILQLLLRRRPKPLLLGRKVSHCLRCWRCISYHSLFLPPPPVQGQYVYRQADICDCSLASECRVVP